jgi:type IV secretory pathway ATPase VirB11/archaellum biosynthesis ATPase
MSKDIAGTLRDAVAKRRSFVVMAVPRLAGKTTVMRAMLGELPPGAPVRAIGIDGDDITALLAESSGGYFVIPEIAEGPWAPGYIRGEPVRRIFRGVGTTASLATALHAPDPEGAFEIISGANRVPDRDASKIGLVVYLRSLGRDWREPERRVVATVHQIDGVESGKPRAKLLHRWNERLDRFENA